MNIDKKQDLNLWSVGKTIFTQEMLNDLSALESAEDFRDAVELYLTAVFCNCHPKTVALFNNRQFSPLAKKFSTYWFLFNKKSNDKEVEKLKKKEMFYIPEEGQRASFCGSVDPFGVGPSSYGERLPLNSPIQISKRYTEERKKYDKDFNEGWCV